MIKAIVFDCFGVLYVHHGPEFIKNNAKNYQRIKPALQDLSNQTDYGLISQHEYEQQVAELAGLTLGEVNRHALQGFGRNNELMDYIANSLRSHYKIGLMSNISRGTMERFFTKKERDELFDVAALSSETGMIKPNVSAFVYICEQLGVDSSEAIMIDDNLSNCRGAEIAGMHVIHYDGFAHLRRRLESVLTNTNN
jgi:putative hydrolase of the HAD superfamily